MYTFYAVFGQPVMHSKSPQLFSPLLNGSSEAYTRIRPLSASDLIRICKTLPIKGGSVTAPFKEAIVPMVDQASQEALDIGAINCIRNRDGILEGHNTDYHGVTGALKEAGLSLRGANILVMGAGGAARAAVYGLSKAGARVSICNRTISKAKSLANSFGSDIISWDKPGKLPEFDAVVSALLPEVLPPYMELLSFGLLLDAIYKPSAMTMYTAKKGIPVVRGENWLIHQGVEAAAFYMGVKPEAALLSQRLGSSPDKDKLNIFVLTDNCSGQFSSKPHDLVISAEGLPASGIQSLINEEINLAFGG